MRHRISAQAFACTVWMVVAVTLPTIARAGTITVSPSQDLNPGGQTVATQLSGFAGQPVWVDIAQSAPSGSYCNEVSYASGGTLPAGMTLYLTGFLSNFSPPSGVPPDPCQNPRPPYHTACETSVRTQKTCSVQVRDGATGAVLASTPISFAFPPPACQDGRLVVTVKPDVPSQQSLSVKCSDPSGRGLDYSVVSGPDHGTFRFTSGGGFVYTAAPGYLGEDAVAFKSSAGDQDSNVATVSIDVVKPPPVLPPARSYAFEYTCMRSLAGGIRRGLAFDYVFRPQGGQGLGTPADFSMASFLLNYFMEPDPARPHLSVYYAPGTSFPAASWVAYADPRAWAVPRSRTGCVLAGPSIHLTTRQWFGVSHKLVTKQATHLRCRFQNRGGTLVPWGFGSRVDHVVAHYPITLKHGGYSARTFLNLTLKGPKPTLAYDRTACKRIVP